MLLNTDLTDIIIKFGLFLITFSTNVMIIQQLSVFLENKSGRLTEVLETLGKENIRITALTVADTTEFGILRLIVSDPEKARGILKEQMFTVNMTGVISVSAPDTAKDYAKVLKIL